MQLLPQRRFDIDRDRDSRTNILIGIIHVCWGILTELPVRPARAHGKPRIGAVRDAGGCLFPAAISFGNKGIYTIKFCHKIICVNFYVDKLSKQRKYNFLNFFVDKRYTLVVYLSTR